MEKKKVIISVDAGGTSTRYVVLDKNENILKSYKTGSGSPAVNINAENDIYEKLEEIYEEIKDEYELSAIAIGMSGYALVNTKAYINRLEKRFNTNIIFENDAYMALFSVLQDSYEKGTVIISGTGAIILSYNNGKLFISNGWGELLTERGSAYGLVKDFVCEMIHHNEQRGYYTKLEQDFLNYCGFKEVEEFKMLFYRHRKNEVAKYSEFFCNEANNGNIEAIEWLEKNGEWLAIDCESSLKRVNMDGKFALGFRGGIFDDTTIMSKVIKNRLKEKGYDFDLIETEKNPILGGFYLAKRKGYI